MAIAGKFSLNLLNIFEGSRVNGFRFSFPLKVWAVLRKTPELPKYFLISDFNVVIFLDVRVYLIYSQYPLSILCFLPRLGKLGAIGH